MARPRRSVAPANRGGLSVLRFEVDVDAPLQLAAAVALVAAPGLAAALIA